MILLDRSRIDCLTNTHAIEFDFNDKWAEAIGQSLHYARMTGARAGVVLILSKPNAEVHLDRLTRTIDHYGLPIDVWTIGENDFSIKIEPIEFSPEGGY